MDQLPSEEENSNCNITNIEKKLVDIDPKLFEGIPKPKREKIIQAFCFSLEKIHIGPLPDSETLKEYSAIIPNGADRVMKMAEKQLEHRIKQENRVIGGQVFQSGLGQIFAFIICITVILGAIYVISIGKDLIGLAMVLTALASLAYVFIKGKKKQEENLEERNPKKKK